MKKQIGVLSVGFGQVLRAWLPEVRGGGLECIKAVVKSSLKAISLESRR